VVQAHRSAPAAPALRLARAAQGHHLILVALAYRRFVPAARAYPEEAA
jgi:hypothetical protein